MAVEQETVDREDAGWMQAGAEPHPTGSITHCTVLRNDRFSSVSLRSGDICSEAEPATGIYWRDTRILSHSQFRINGAEPLMLDHHELQHSLTAVFTNRPFTDQSGAQIRQQSLIIRRRHVIDKNFYASLSIS